MITVLQRVSSARVLVGAEVVGAIDAGFLALVGVAPTDTEHDALELADRVARLRVFPDAAGKMNRSLLDVGASVLAVSQFTLCADVRGGRRPSFDSAAPPALAEPLFACFCAAVTRLGVRVETGRFGAEMTIELVNVGPATFVLDSTWWTAGKSGPRTA